MCDVYWPPCCIQGKEGTSLDQYVPIANDILFNPEGTLERVEQEDALWKQSQELMR